MQAGKTNRAKELEVILTLCVALVVIFFVTHQAHRWLLTLSVVIGAIGMFSKWLTTKIAWAWLKLSEMIGFVMSKLILSLLFFVFVFPIAMLSRLFSKKDELRLKKTDEPSYYITRNHTFTAKDMENVW